MSLNLYQEYQVFVGKKEAQLEECKNIFILNRWISFNPANSRITALVDRLQRGSKDKELIKRILYNGVKRGSFSKYLKKEKENKDLDGYLQKYFNFSSRELSFQKHLIDLNKTFLNELALSFGWDKRTCKKFGADYKDLPKPKKIKEKPKPTGPSLFDF